MRRLAILLGLLPVMACTPPLQIHLDERADFTRYRTWSWLPDAPRTIDAPVPHAIGLDRDLASQVERALGERGFVRVARGGDLRVGAALNVRRETESVMETGAVEHLSTYTSDGTYLVQRSTLRRVTYDRSRLAIFVIHPGSQTVVWKGAIERRDEGGFSPHLGKAVARLLDRFPTAGAGGDAPGRRAPSPREWTLHPSEGSVPDA
jgi:hypothetical protein